MKSLSLRNKFILVFGSFGFFLSLLTGIVAGVSFGSVVLRAFIFLLVFSALGFGLHFLFEFRMPEVLEVLTGQSGDDELEAAADAEDLDVGEGGAVTASEGEGGESYTGGGAVGLGDSSPAGARNLEGEKKSGVFGDHILVEGVKIQNEPKLMAEAVRTMLAKDDE